MSVMYNPPAKYARSIEIFPNTAAQEGDKFNFPLDNELNERDIVAIDVWAREQCEFSPNGRRLVDSQVLAVTSISLFQDEDLRYNEIPVRTFRLLDNNGNRQYLKDFRVNLQNSYIKINVGGAVGDTDTFLFTFWYNK